MMLKSAEMIGDVPLEDNNAVSFLESEVMQESMKEVSRMLSFTLYWYWAELWSYILLLPDSTMELHSPATGLNYGVTLSCYWVQLCFFLMNKAHIYLFRVMIQNSQWNQIMTRV